MRVVLEMDSEEGRLSGELDVLEAQRIGKRRSGKIDIAQELRAKGVDEATAGPALETVDAEVEAEQALVLGRSLISSRRLADAQALVAYVGPRLARRGFSGGLVYRVCRLLSDEWEASGRFDSPQIRD